MLAVTTTNFRDGYLRKNGVRYSANASIGEYFDRVGPEPNGDLYLIVRTIVEDGQYLTLAFITSAHFEARAERGVEMEPDAVQDRPADRQRPVRLTRGLLATATCPATSVLSSSTTPTYLRGSRIG